MTTQKGAPIAMPINEEEDFTPNPLGPEIPPGIGGRLPRPGFELPFPPIPTPPIQWPPQPWPQQQFCLINLKQGCYKIHYKPASPLARFSPYYAGTLRIENSGASKIISGDFYKLSNVIGPIIVGPVIPAVLMAVLIIHLRARLNLF